MKNKKPMEKRISIRLPLELYALVIALKPDRLNLSDVVRLALMDKYHEADLYKTTQQLEEEILYNLYGPSDNESEEIDIIPESEMEE